MVTSLQDIPTPALVLDRERLLRNAAAMAARADALGVPLRPHVKTAKSVEVIKLALGGTPGPITVSTLNEAEVFAAAGFNDVRLAVCMTPDKLARAAELVRGGVALSLITDDAGLAAELSRTAQRLGVVFDVLVEVDVGEHRTGVAPASDALLETARAVYEGPGTRLVGVLGHAGQAYDARGAAAIAAVAQDERRALLTAAARVRAACLPCDEVSAGSTPTAVHLADGSGLTELRPGVYLFFDVFQAAVGCCSLQDIAVSVLATVIAHRRESGGLVLDAGALALSKDRSTASTDLDAGFGLVMGVDGAPLAPSLHAPSLHVDGLRVDGVHQEHGEVRGVPEAVLDALPIGSRVRVLPNHACLTAAAYDCYHVVAGDTVVTDVWTRTNGWGAAVGRAEPVLGVPVLEAPALEAQS